MHCIDTSRCHFCYVDRAARDVSINNQKEGRDAKRSKKS